MLKKGIDMGKTVKNILLTLLILSLSISTALLAYLHFFASEDTKLEGEWTAELDMAQQAAVTALGWLQDIEGVSVSLEDIEPYMQDLTVQTHLAFEQTARSRGATQGTFRCGIVPESYDACRQAAYEAFALAFQKLLAERLHMAGYTGGTDGENIEGLVKESFGMSTVDYLMSYGPALLPALEELQVQYEGSGVYEAAEGILTRHFGSGEAGGAAVRERYIRKELHLILTDEADESFPGPLADFYPIIYTLKEDQAQQNDVLAIPME